MIRNEEYQNMTLAEVDNGPIEPWRRKLIAGSVVGGLAVLAFAFGVDKKIPALIERDDQVLLEQAARRQVARDGFNMDDVSRTSINDDRTSMTFSLETDDCEVVVTAELDEAHGQVHDVTNYTVNDLPAIYQRADDVMTIASAIC